MGERRVVGSSAARRVARNTLAPIAARVIDAGFALVYLRLLGRADVGAYTFVVVFTTYLDTLVDFGLNALVAREVPRTPALARPALGSVSLLRLGLWLAGLPLVLAVYGPLRQVAGLSDEAAVAGGVFYLALLPTVLAKTASGILWGLERLEVTAGVSVVATMLKTVLGAAALFAGFGLLGLAVASVLVNIVTAGSLMAMLRLPPGQTSTRPGLRWLRESWPLFLNQLLQGLFFKIDALLLPALAGLTAAGVYGAAYRVSEGAGIISSSFTLALFPRLARAADLAAAYRVALRLLLQLAMPLAAGTALLAEPIIFVVGGREYLPEAAMALTILICYLPLSFANGLIQYVLIAAGRQRSVTLAFVAALLINVLANLALIPRFGYVGAAWVTVASEVVLLIPFTAVVGRLAPGVSALAEARAPFLATLLMAPVVWWLRDAVHPLAAVAAGATIYPVALWAVGGIDAQQWALVRELTPPVVSVRLPRP
ncbi:MAG: flippase [Chloroflexota bacterium]|nr:flippase [Chloroflexota bacterium]